MTPRGNRWESAEAALRAHLGVTPEVLARDVERVEVTRDERLVWSLANESGKAWFEVDGDRVTELLPVDDARLPGADQLAGTGVISWRSGRRAVHSPDGSRIRKFYRRTRLGEAERRHRAVLSAQSEIEPWRVPEIVSVDPSIGAIEFEPVRGESIGVTDDAVERWSTVGAGLAAFQSAVRTEGLERRDRAAELDVVRATHRKHVVAFSERVEGLDASIDRLSRFVAGGDSRRCVASHRDLHDGQLLWDDGRVHVLDLDLLCAAEPELDVANLTAHLVLRSLQSGHTAVDEDDAATECAAALMSGARVGADERARAAMRFYQATTYLRLSMVYALRPRWRGLSPALKARAEASLRELEFVGA